ncbi:MAG: DUF177 domain-containing protein [Coriobacteriia bacterium]|nr:DUF177 domain-containing protein [Coriobacteriia bacterium]
MAERLIPIQIPDQLFSVAETMHFQGTYEIDQVEAGPDVYAFQGPVSWEAQITNTGDALLVAGSANAQVSTECARCLDPVVLDLQGVIEGYFLIGDDAEEPEDMVEDEFDTLSEDGVLDMEPLVMAAILLEVPLIPLCTDDCAGLCPQCGANLNQEQCDCQPEPEVAPENPFAVLANLSFD